MQEAQRIPSSDLTLATSIDCTSDQSLHCDKSANITDSSTIASYLNPQDSTPIRKCPPCVVCGDPSSGVHFGVDSCGACCAFFRRSVTVKKEFVCNGDGTKPCANLKGSNSCKSCRFDRCLSQGMDVGSVQYNRDSIGQYSSKARSRQEKNTILDDLYTNYALEKYRRLLLYSMDNNIEDILNYDELPIKELRSISECFYQLLYLEPRLTADFMRSMQFLRDAKLSDTEMLKLFKNFNVTRQAVEEPFLTYKYGFLQHDRWVMINRRYIDIRNTKLYFEDGTMDGLTLNRETTENLFLPSIKSAMENVSARMEKHRISEIEMVALCGVTLFDPGVDGLSNESRNKLLRARGHINTSLFNYYLKEIDVDPEIKLGNLYLDVYTYCKVHAIKKAENIQLLEIFDLVPSMRSGNFSNSQKHS